MRIRSPLLHAVFARAVVLLSRVVFFTVRTQVVFIRSETSCYTRRPGGARYAYCLWHDAIVMAALCRRPKDCAILVSRHQDGGLLAAAMKQIGLTPVRGSSSRGGAQAVRQMMDQAVGLHFTITPDGPRGPRREVKDGIIYLASRTGHPIVPTAAVTSRGWSIRGSWTNMVVPKPCARCVLFGGEPIQVPADLAKDEIPRVRALLQTAMEQAEQDAMRVLETGSHEPPACDAAEPTQSARAA